MDVGFRLSHLQSSANRLSESQAEAEKQNQPRKHVGRYIALTHSTASASDSNNHSGSSSFVFLGLPAQNYSDFKSVRRNWQIGADLSRYSPQTRHLVYY